MYLLGEQPAYADAWINRLQSITAQMFEGLTPAAPAIDLPDGADVLERVDDAHIYLIQTGMVHARLNDRPLFYLQDGDILGLRLDRQAPQCLLRCEGAVHLLPYDRRAALAHVGASAQRQELLLEYMAGQSTLAFDAITRLKPPEFRSANGFKQVAAGDILIKEGDEADHVFVIIDGRAEAFVGGHKVGDVPKDEIFGAMAVFTAEKRNATVIASVPCTVMMIPKDQFLSLTQSNPRIAHSLIESMARRIDALNRQIAKPD